MPITTVLEKNGFASREYWGNLKILLMYKSQTQQNDGEMMQLEQTMFKLYFNIHVVMVSNLLFH